jgi:hypothetical protein
VHYQVNSQYYVIIATKAIGYATIFNPSEKNYMPDHFIDARVMYSLKLINNFDLSMPRGIVDEE